MEINSTIYYYISNIAMASYIIYFSASMSCFRGSYLGEAAVNPGSPIGDLVRWTNCLYV
jgi:hypothetical protein